MRRNFLVGGQAPVRLRASGQKAKNQNKQDQAHRQASQQAIFLR
jgi:hypothetical protein